jgi:hypothetical protein
MLSGERQQNALQQSGQVFSAFKAGKPEIAISLLDRQIEAKRNSGDNEGAMFLETWRDVAKENPKATEDYFGFTISQMPGGDKVIESAGKLGAERRAEAQAPAELRQKLADANKAEAEAKVKMETATDDIAKAKATREFEQAKAIKEQVAAKYAEPLAQGSLNLNAAQIKNINSEINNRAAKLNLDHQIMQATVAEKLSSIQKNVNEMPADTRKLVNESAVTAAASKQSADQYNDLAKRLEAAGGGYGAASTFSDFATKTLGLNQPLTQLRQEYTRIRNSAAIKSLPPGVATDKDIELALKGIPPENADARTMSSFLRGMAKLQDVEASVANAKTDWLANNNGVLTRAKNTFMAGDYNTKPGESFNDFTQRVVQDVSKRYDPTQQTSLVQQIPTDRNPRPMAATSSIEAQAEAIIRGGR